MALEGDGTSASAFRDALGQDQPPITMCAWGMNYTTNVEGIVASGTKVDDTKYYTLLMDSDKSVYFQSRHETHVQAGIGSAWSQDVWGHLAGTETSNSNRSVFWNGTSKSTNTQDSGTDYGAVRLEAGKLNYVLDSNHAPIDGRVAEMAVWDVVLSDQEIEMLAKGFTPDLVRRDTLVNYCPLVRELQDLITRLPLTPGGSPGVAGHPRVFMAA